MTLLSEIEQYLTRSGMSKTRLGVTATGEGRIVQSMREGRQASPATAKAVRNVMAQHPDGVPFKRYFTGIKRRIVLPKIETAPPRIQGDGYPCGHCGQARLGCEHRPLDFYV